MERMDILQDYIAKWVKFNPKAKENELYDRYNQGARTEKTTPEEWLFLACSVLTFCIENDFKNSDFIEKSGVSKSSLSSLMNLNFQANQINDKLYEEISLYLSNVKQENIAPTNLYTTIKNIVVDTTQKLGKDILTFQLYEANSGSGKTFTLGKISSIDNNIKYFPIGEKNISSIKEGLFAFVSKENIKVKDFSMRFEQEVTKKQDKFIILIDEAECMNKRMLAILKDLYDIAERTKKFSILVFGAGLSIKYSRYLSRLDFQTGYAQFMSRYGKMPIPIINDVEYNEDIKIFLESGHSIIGNKKEYFSNEVINRIIEIYSDDALFCIRDLATKIKNYLGSEERKPLSKVGIKDIKFIF